MVFIPLLLFLLFPAFPLAIEKIVSETFFETNTL